jgi:hypothetical protein
MTMKNGTKQIVIGSTGKKYTVSKTKAGKMECSCPRWTNTSPRKNCKHILSVLTGKPVAETKAIAAKPTVKINVKAASEKVYKLISSQPGKCTRRVLAKKLNLSQETIAAGCEALWAAKKITKGRSKEGWLAGGYIPRKAKA